MGELLGKVELLKKFIQLLETSKPVKVQGRWFGIYEGDIVMFAYKNSDNYAEMIDEPDTDKPLGMPQDIRFWLEMAEKAEKEDVFKEEIEYAKVLAKLSDHEYGLYHEWVDKIEYQKLGSKTVIAFVTLYNGWEFVGKAHALDVTKFEMHIGKTYALKDALNQLDGLAGFHKHIREKG